MGIKTEDFVPGFPPKEMTEGVDWLGIKYVPSDGMIKYHAKQLHRIIFDRFNRHGFEYYQSSSPILTTFEYLQKIVEKWFPIDVL